MFDCDYNGAPGQQLKIRKQQINDLNIVLGVCLDYFVLLLYRFLGVTGEGSETTIVYASHCSAVALYMAVLNHTSEIYKVLAVAQ